MRTKLMAIVLLTMVLASWTHGVPQTNRYALGAANGSALGFVGVIDWDTYAWKYPYGFWLQDKGLNSTAIPATNLSPYASVDAFDGKNIVTADHESNVVCVYALSASGLQLLNSFSGSLYRTVVQKSNLLLLLDAGKGASRGSKSPSYVTILAVDRKHASVRWSVPIVQYSDSCILADDLVVGQSNRFVFFYKKGKLWSTMDLAVGKYDGPDFAYGTDGTVAYWVNDINGTNTPVTYRKKNGGVAGLNLTFPEAGPVWDCLPIINKGIFYLYTNPGVSNCHLYAYKLGSTATLLGSVEVPYLNTIGLDGANLYALCFYPDDTWLVKEFKKDLSSLAWQSPVGSGEGIERVGKGVYSRPDTMASPITIAIIDKKSSVLHQFPVPAR